MALAGFKKKLLTHVGIAFGIIAVLAVFIFLLNKDINSRVDKIEAAKQEIALRTQTIQLLTGANSDLKKADMLLANLQNLLPDKDQLINFPRELAGSAKNYVVDLGFNFKEEVPPTAGNPGNIKFTMTVSGAYDNIIDFLKVVEAHRYLISLDSVDVSRSGKDNTYSLITTGEIYIK